MKNYVVSHSGCPAFAAFTTEADALECVEYLTKQGLGTKFWVEEVEVVDTVTAGLSLYEKKYPLVRNIAMRRNILRVDEE